MKKSMLKSMPKSHEFHEKRCENSMIFGLKFFEKSVVCEKVPNANKRIKTNGFLMISWFARFKNRFDKLQKNHEQYIERSDARIIDKSFKINEK